MPNPRSPATMHTFTKAVEQLTEVNFWAFDTYKVLLPALLHECHQATVPEPGINNVITTALGAAGSIIGGLHHLTDKQTHRQTATQLKGSIEILNGMQLIVLTAIASVALPIGVAVAASSTFIAALEPLYIAIKRHYHFRYWFSDSLQQVSHQEKNIAALRAALARLHAEQEQQTTDVFAVHALAWVINQKKNRLNALQAELCELKTSIVYRLAYRKQQGLALEPVQRLLGQHESVPLDASRCQKNGLRFKNTLRTLLQTPIENLCPQVTQTLARIQKTSRRPKQATPLLDFNHYEKKYRAQTAHACRAHAHTLLTSSIAAIGCVFLCVPGLQLAAAALLATAALLYFQKNIRSLFRTLFGNKPKAATNTTPVQPLPHQPTQNIAPHVTRVSAPASPMSAFFCSQEKHVSLIPKAANPVLPPTLALNETLIAQTVPEPPAPAIALAQRSAEPTPSLCRRVLNAIKPKFYAAVGLGVIGTAMVLANNSDLSASVTDMVSKCL